jgi:endonuclease YncB( thermonuclease family)
VKKNKDKTTYAMSRRRRGTIIALCLLTVVVLIWLDHNTVKCKPQQHESENQTVNYDFQKYHAKAFTVANVVDGDTIDIDIADDKDDNTRIRLWGIDTPESKHPQKGVCYFGPQAADFTTKSVLGKQVTVYLEVHRTRGKFGRLLAYIQLPDSRFLNEVLLSEGFAYADLRFRHSFYNKYNQLEAAARSAKKGLWKNATRDQLPEWLQKRKPNLLRRK